MIPSSSRQAVMHAVMAFLAVFVLPWALAQTAPGNAVRLVVGYPPGGSGDIVTHAVSDKLATALGQPVSVEYRPGASGAVGARSVARAAPDGRTLLVGQTTEVVINRTLARELGYDPDTDLVPVALLAKMPLALIVAADSPHSTIGQLVEASRSSPRGLLFASPGAGTPGHLAGELLSKRLGVRMVHVPYEGGSAALDAVLSHRVDFHFQALPTAMPAATAGKVKILAVSSSKRAPAIPDVRALTEIPEFAGFDVTLWAGMFAPRRTSPEEIARLNKAINQVLDDSVARRSLEQSGAEVTPISPTAFAAFLQDETGKYEALIKDEFCARLFYGGCGGFRGALDLLP